MKASLIFILVILCLSCKEKSDNNASESYEYGLSETKVIKSFPLDDETRYNPFYLYTFEDKGKEYLSFLNYRTNQLLFYDLNTCNPLFKVELDREGPHGIGTASGYYIQDFDNMYVSTYNYFGLIKVDTASLITQKIPYRTTQEGYKVLPSYTPSSHPFVAPVQIENDIYITQIAAEHIFPSAKTPVSIKIDTISKDSRSLPFTFGDALSEEQLSARECSFSRIYNDNKFVYSFYIEPDIFVASKDHKQIKRIKVESKYIKKISIKSIPEDFIKGAKQSLELARYGDLIYDRYRNVYYRFAYLETELDNNISWRGKAVYGRAKSSVIILDAQFNIIGETLLAENLYNTFAYFISKEGLYISKDYQMNYEQSEDYMTFELFELKKLTN